MVFGVLRTTGICQQQALFPYARSTGSGGRPATAVHKQQDAVETRHLSARMPHSHLERCDASRALLAALRIEDRTVDPFVAVALADDARTGASALRRPCTAKSFELTSCARRR
jgi:hypothetical protein